MKDIFWSQPGELVTHYHELLKLKENVLIDPFFGAEKASRQLVAK